jgi:MOSC domain-containing protein YiiM
MGLLVSREREAMGKLLGIARKASKRAPMEEIDAAQVSEAAGLEGDYRGKPGHRQVTVLAREAWQAVCGELGEALPWTLRRANLLVEGVHLPQRPGDRLRVGGLLLEVTGECDPCTRMDEQRDGLTEALRPDWRGGVTCQVVEGGAIAIGDIAELIDGA